MQWIGVKVFQPGPKWSSNQHCHLYNHTTIMAKKRWWRGLCCHIHNKGQPVGLYCYSVPSLACQPKASVVWWEINPAWNQGKHNDSNLHTQQPFQVWWEQQGGGGTAPTEKSKESGSTLNYKSYENQHHVSHTQKVDLQGMYYHIPTHVTQHPQTNTTTWQLIYICNWNTKQEVTVNWEIHYSIHALEI